MLSPVARSPAAATQPQRPVVTSEFAYEVLDRYLKRDEFTKFQRTAQWATTTGKLGIAGLAYAPQAPLGALRGTATLLWDVREGLGVLGYSVVLPLLSPALLGVSACLWGASTAALVPGVMAAVRHDQEREDAAKA